MSARIDAIEEQLKEEIARQLQNTRDDPQEQADALRGIISFCEVLIDGMKASIPGIE